MKKRRYGRTNHMSTLAVFGAFAMAKIDQVLADKVINDMINAGVNHIDIAPSYGEAELRLGPWMPKIRDNFFLGCKTTERRKAGAMQEAHLSLERMQVDSFDLYQLHAITTMDELDAVTAKGGALEALINLRDEGLTNFIGITGHGLDTPALFIEALSRFNFDSVLFPINATLFADDTYRAQSLKLLDICEEQDVGVMAIKAVAKEPWGDQDHRYNTGYIPFEDENAIEENIHFVLSQKLTHICTPGDYRLLNSALRACENYEEMPPEEMEALIEKQSGLESIF